MKDQPMNMMPTPRLISMIDRSVLRDLYAELEASGPLS